MATGTLQFTPGAAVFPDGTASNAAPQLIRVKSSAAAPGVYFLHLAFDTTTEEWCTWQFRMPSDYASGPVAKVQYKMASAVTGGVAFDVRLGTIDPGVSTSDADAKGFAAANVGTQTVPATTAGKVGEVSITLTNADSVLAGDWCVIRLARAVANASDTAAGDCEVVVLALEYTTT